MVERLLPERPEPALLPGSVSQVPLSRFSPPFHGCRAPYVANGRGRRPWEDREHRAPVLRWPIRHDPPQEVRPDDERRLSHPSSSARCPARPCCPARSAELDPAELGRGRARARGPGLPPRLPAHRQPARRRGPHPGDVRPGVPLAGLLQAGHVRGLAAPHHHEPVPGHGAPPLAHPHGGAARGHRPHPRPRPGAGAGVLRHPPRPRAAGGARRAAAGVPRRRRPLRRGGPVLRGDRRDARREAGYGEEQDPPRPCRAAQRRSSAAGRRGRPRGGARRRYTGELQGVGASR